MTSNKSDIPGASKFAQRRIKAEEIRAQQSENGEGTNGAPSLKPSPTYVIVSAAPKLDMTTKTQFYREIDREVNKESATAARIKFRPLHSDTTQS